MAFYNVSISGEKGDIYYCPETKRCIAAVINSETGNTQPIGERQITNLRTQHQLD